MLDGFEARLADLFADRLAGAGGLLAPVRTRPAAVPNDGILPVLQVARVGASPLLGDDAPLVRRGPGGIGLRTVLALDGVVTLELIPAAAVTRTAWLQALDAVLIAFAAPEMRNGRAFETGADLGFALRGFRFLAADAPQEADGAPLGTAQRLCLRFAFEGEFWPVRPDAVGPAIASIPTRIVGLPVGLPVESPLAARAGGPDLIIPLALDLRRLGAAPGSVVARLSGAAPPGTLQGDTPGAPPGHAGFAVDADGVARLVFRPSGALAAPARTAIQVALAEAGAPRTALAEIAVQVLP